MLRRLRTQRGQRGDTLVEVVFAASILTVLLVSAYNIANLSFRIGTQARERTEASRLLQDQAERLRLYRDKLVTTYADQATTYPIMDSLHFPCSPKDSVGCFFNPNTPITDATTPTTCTVGDPCYTDPTGRYRVYITGDIPASGIFRPTIHVRWTSAVGNVQNDAKLDLVLVDKRGITPRDCSVAGDTACE